MWNNRNDLATRQQFRADYRMKPDTFMDIQKQSPRSVLVFRDRCFPANFAKFLRTLFLREHFQRLLLDTFTLVRNRLEKPDTRFREAFLIEKKVVIAFRSSNRRCSMKKDVFRNFTFFTEKHPWQVLFFNKVLGLRPATLLKKRLWHMCFPLNFAKFQRKPFLRNTFGRLLLCFMAFSDWEFLPQLFKSIWFWKIDCGKHYHLSKYFIKFPRTPSGTAKAIATVN